MKKIRFGIVGVGNQGTYYANILKEGKVTNGILVGLCDNDPSKIEKAKFKINAIKIFLSVFIISSC